MLFSSVFHEGFVLVQWPRCLVVMSGRKTSVNPANTNMPAQDVFNVSCRHAAYLSTVMFLSLLPRRMPLRASQTARTEKSLAIGAHCLYIHGSEGAHL